MRIPYEILFLTGAFDGGFRGSDGDWFISALLFCYFCFPVIKILISEMKEKHKWALLCCLGLLAGAAPVVQYFNKFGLVYPNPFFRMLQFAIGVIFASCCVDHDRLESRHTPILYGVYSLFLGVVLAAGIFLLMEIFSAGDYMYLTYFTIPVFVLMIYFFYHIKEPVLQVKWLQKMIVFFSAISLPFYIAQRFCFLVAEKIITFLGLEQHRGAHLNLVRLLMSTAIAIGIGILFDAADKKIRKTILKHGNGIGGKC